METTPVLLRRADRDDRYAHIRQYSRGELVAIWAAAALPMGFLAWVVTPLLSHRLSGPEPIGRALLITFNVGLLWLLALTLLLVHREVGTLAWPRVRDALWLRAPLDPKSGKVGGKVWWWTVPF